MECFSISARFLCFSKKQMESAPMVLQFILVQVWALQVLNYTSPPLLTQCSETVHQNHCLIVYPLLISKTETLNRGNSSSSGFMPHSKHVFPAICFQFWLKFERTAQAYFTFLFLPWAGLMEDHLHHWIIFVYWVVEVCELVACMVLTSHLCMSHRQWKLLPSNTG